MSIAAISVIWALLQISFVCILSLSIAWLQRGRHPQFVTAMLAGTCIATLLLALSAFMPACQWRLVTTNQNEPTFTVNDTNPKPHAHPDHLNTPVASATASPNSTAPRRNSQVTADSIHAFEAIQDMLSYALDRVDHEVRQAEQWQQPIATARNYSLSFFYSSA